MPFIMTRAGGACMGFPDVCLVPASPNPIPTPFLNIGDCRVADRTIAAVQVEGADAIVESSRLPYSSGDEAGTGGGIVSGTFLGCVKFKTASAKVKARGKRVVLLGGVTGQNGDTANVIGQTVIPGQNRVIARF